MYALLDHLSIGFARWAEITLEPSNIWDTVAAHVRTDMEPLGSVALRPYDDSVEEDFGRHLARVALVNGRGYEGAFDSLVDAPLPYDWGWVYVWGTSPDNHGIVVVAKDLQQAWPIRIAPRGGDLDTFVKQYSEEFRLAFDPSATRAKPSRLHLAAARVLASRSTAFAAAVLAVLGVLALLRPLWPTAPWWISIVLGVLAGLSVSALLGLLAGKADKQLATAIHRELGFNRYAHLLAPIEHMYSHCVALAGPAANTTQLWAEKFNDVREVLARNTYDELPGRVALLMTLAQSEPPTFSA